jgi:hypothetical protein
MTTAPFELDLEALNELPEPERRRELQRLAPLQKMLDSNPLWSWVPHEGEREWKLEQGLPLLGGESRGQTEFLEVTCKTGAYVAGNRAGKTDVGAVWAAIQTLPLDQLPPWLHCYKRWGLDGEEVYGRIIGPDLAQWLAKVMLPKLRRRLPKEALWKGEFDKAYNDRERKLRFADGSWWDFLTHEMDVDAFAGADMHFIWFDEEPAGEKGKEQYEESLMRLIDYNGHIRWTLTPLLGLNFVYHKLTDADGAPRDDDKCKVVTGDIDHNPHLSSEGRDAAMEEISSDPLRLQARKSGRWVHFAGRIYGEFTRETHVVPDSPLPRDQNEQVTVPVYAAIDPGINKDHQAGLVFAWCDEQGQLEFFHAVKWPDRTVEDIASYFHMFCAEHMFTPRWTVIDPAALNRHHVTGRSTQWEYQKHGVWTLPGQNNRQAGFNAVKERLRNGQLVVQASCDDLVNEFYEYRWKTPRGIREDAPKAEPIKRNDDLLDALRYLVMSMPQAAESRPEPSPHDRDRELVREHLEYMAGDQRGRVGGVL